MRIARWTCKALHHDNSNIPQKQDHDISGWLLPTKCQPLPPRSTKKKAYIHTSTGSPPRIWNSPTRGLVKPIEERFQEGGVSQGPIAVV
ncbi:hypothetical protein NDU88_002687 [Pleurodeles waltl]|uniref:Uncharacterized protein n=1 Tax=Pleurodeles waltl TaxID=8319 RepID=A0AAV7UBK2_PLEWA|nr:hypothetical protein NDU88_002687 [Pleurodeles waltl]